MHPLSGRTARVLFPTRLGVVFYSTQSPRSRNTICGQPPPPGSLALCDVTRHVFSRLVSRRILSDRSLSFREVFKTLTTEVLAGVRIDVHSIVSDSAKVHLVMHTSRQRHQLKVKRIMSFNVIRMNKMTGVEYTSRKKNGKHSIASQRQVDERRHNGSDKRVQDSQSW